jgi:ankyrin repeat protein
MSTNTNINLNFSINTNFDELIEINNDSINNIFKLIKMNKWDDLINFISDNKENIDLNVKDSSNISLLEYAVIFNQIKLIDLLLENNICIDVTDDSSKSILYHVIKFSYTDILIKLLEKNKSVIGKSILDISDKDGNIPLFYSMQFYNIECLKIILKYTTNFYIKNHDGDNCLHIAIKTQNNEIFNIVLSHFNNLTLKNNNGESFLHLIVKFKCYDMLKSFIEKNISNERFIELLNLIEYKFNFTILHYISINMDSKCLEIFDKYDLLKYFDGNIQDNSGNIFFIQTWLSLEMHQLKELKTLNCDLGFL